MKKIAILILCAVLTSQLTYAQTSSTSPLLIHFETDNANISTEAAGILENSVTGLKGGPEKYRVEITAHTDLRGSLAYNQDLSKRRGEAVAAFLKSKGFNPENIQIVAEGETKPLVNDETDIALAENRRVEVRFLNLKATASHNNVPVANLKFPSEKGCTFSSPRSGNKVHIPPGSLVKKDGTPVTGPVDLQYREYLTTADFAASGIPMHFRDDRGEFFFNSGGMFEVHTYQDGEELYVAPGKNYTVDFSATRQLSDANLFIFNDDANQWDYISSSVFAAPVGFGDVIPATETNRAVVSTEANIIRNNLASTPNPCTPMPVFFPNGVDHAEQVMEGIRTGLALAEGKEKMETWFKKFPNRSAAFFLASLENSTIEVVGSFSAQFFPDDKTGVFKELSAFKDHYFEADSVETTSLANLFKTPGSTNPAVPTSEIKKFRSLVVEYEGNGKCLLTFNDGITEKQVHARLQMSTELAGRLNYNDADEVMETYKKLRNERQGAILDKIERWKNFLATARIFQTTQEWCLTDEAWLQYFEKNRSVMRKRYQTLMEDGTGKIPPQAALALKSFNAKQQIAAQMSPRLTRFGSLEGSDLTTALSLQKFGIYNCDQIFKLQKDPEIIAAQFFTPDGKPVNPTQISIIERDRKMYFTTNCTSCMYKMPERRIDYIITGAAGNTYYLSAKEYQSLEFDTAGTLKVVVNDVTDKAQSPKEWAALLRI